MKLQIDTTNKILTIEERVNLKEFFILLNNLFPDFEWENFSLDIKPITNWYNPMTIPLGQPLGNLPWYNPVVGADGWQSDTITLQNVHMSTTPTVTILGGNISNNITDTVYCVEIEDGPKP